MRNFRRTWHPTKNFHAEFSQTTVIYFECMYVCICAWMYVAVWVYMYSYHDLSEEQNYRQLNNLKLYLNEYYLTTATPFIVIDIVKIMLHA